MNSISNKYGMTIIETLMAIVVLSMALLALSGMQISAFDISNNSNKLTKAIVVTQDTIELLMSVDFTDKNLNDPTPVNEYTSYKLSKATLKIDPPSGINVSWAIDNQNDDTKLINVTTTWRNRGTQRSLVLPLRRTRQQ
jgi:prepilin-type N-terminal cleavage/methylation domain-containing protein